MKHCDLIIAGGGLAGLGLAQQLKTVRPDLAILVLEKQSFPRPKAIAKVGESTVEIGSRYLAKHLGLEEHLRQNHLKKFGLRMFFGASANEFAIQDELGASQTFGIPTYQIDRGDLENHLASKLIDAGVAIVDQAVITRIDVNSSIKKIDFITPEGAGSCTAPWLVDAAGRAALLKTRLELGTVNRHKGNAVWFRIDKKILIDNWSTDAAWQQRCTPNNSRWLSTNHLTGPGYWIWLIPLASGVTSVGIVMDDQVLQESGIHDGESAMRWLYQRQKRCALAIEGAKFLDFVLLRDYSYDCRQVFSSQGWGITGEAGVFADPFYSPGSDFIALGNGFIAELIESQFRGEDIRLKALVFDKLFASIYHNTLSLYTGQYGGFGDRVMMGLKLLWDYSYYWGVLSLLYFRNALCNLEVIRSLSSQLQQAQELNQQVQASFRCRAAQRLVLPHRGIFMDQYQIPCLQYFNAVLAGEGMEDLSEQLRHNIGLINEVSLAITDMLGDWPSRQINDAERSLLGDYRHQILAC